MSLEQARAVERSGIGYGSEDAPGDCGALCENGQEKYHVLLPAAGHCSHQERIWPYLQ
jgi:hypothetical protein